MAIKISGSTIIDDSRNIVNAGVTTVGVLTGTDAKFSGTVEANEFLGTGTKLSGIVTSIVAGSNISVDQSTGQVTITGLANTANVISDTITTGTLNVTGVSTFQDNVDIAGNLAVDTNTLFVNSTTNRIGIGTDNPAYQVEIENTGANALLVLDRTDGAACFIEGQDTRSAFGSVNATPLALAYNSFAVVTIGAGGSIRVNPDGDGYTFPTTDGSADQVLQTDGEGNLSFASVLTGLGIQTAGGYLGAGITTFDFQGSGISSITSPSLGISTIFLKGVTVSDTPPSNAFDDDLWLDSTTMDIKIYYNDGDTRQWVDVGPSLTNFDSLWVKTDAGIHTLTSVGVGTTNPTANLDVDGRTELDITNISETLNVVGLSTFGSDVDINAGLDVNGHTELDNLNVSGVSTFTGSIDANGNLNVDGRTELDITNISETLNVVGITTLASSGGITTTGGDLYVGGDARIAGILTVGTSSLILDGSINRMSGSSGLELKADDGVFLSNSVPGFALRGSYVGIGTTNGIGARLHVVGQIPGSNPSTGSAHHIARFYASDYVNSQSGGITLGAYWDNVTVTNRHAYIQSSQGKNPGGSGRALLLNPSGSNVTVGLAAVGNTKLDVDGEITARSGLQLSSTLDYNRILRDGTNNGIAFRTGGSSSNQMLLTDGGRLNINYDSTAYGKINAKIEPTSTISTSEILSASNNGTNAGLLIFSDDDNQAGIVLQSGASLAGQWGIYAKYQTSYEADLQFWTRSAANASTQRMVLTENGNLGINETDPDDRLHITNGNIILENTDGGSSSAPTLELYRNSSSPSGSDSLGQIYFYGEDSSSNKVNYGRILAQIDPYGTPTAGITSSWLRTYHKSNGSNYNWEFRDQGFGNSFSHYNCRSTSGDFELRFRLEDLTGSVWRAAAALVVYRGVNGTLGSNTYSFSRLSFTGLSSWGTPSFTAISGATISITSSNNTDKGVHVQFDVSNSNAGSVMVWTQSRTGSPRCLIAG